MNDSIYTIPVSEVFEPKEGCPFCSMRNTLEQRAIDYIMGAAMMEPDVRQETNRLGFCREHFDQMLHGKNRLSLALMLESHLAEIQKNVFEGKGLFAKAGKKSGLKNGDKVKASCFVCSKIDWAMERMLDTVLSLYEKEKDFRKLYAEQETICFPHYLQVCALAQERMAKNTAGEFIKATTGIVSAYLDGLQGDVAHFCKMFDYRNTGEGADWGNSKDSIERAVWFLTARECE